MLDLLAMAKALSNVAAITASDELCKALLPCVDATRLLEDDEAQAVCQFVDDVRQLPLASVCIYPPYISQVKPMLDGTSIRLGSVVNFPQGDDSSLTIVDEIKSMIQSGVEEIDVVFPHQAYLHDDSSLALDTIAACKQACDQTITLKVILESGSFESLNDLYRASQDVISLEVDFIKTSTGKYPVGATMDAAYAMLSAIKDSGKACGFKVSGGIKSLSQACQYYCLAQSVLEKECLGSNSFRLGTSQLITELQRQCNTQE